MTATLKRRLATAAIAACSIAISAPPAAAAATTVASCTTPALQLVELGPVVGGESANGCRTQFTVNPPTVRVSITPASQDATGVISAWICQGASCTEVERQTYRNAVRIYAPTDLDLPSTSWPITSGTLFVGSYDGGITGPCFSVPFGGCALPYLDNIQLNTVQGSFTGSLVTT